MRLVQVTVPDEKRAAVMDVLDEEGIDFVVAEAPNDPDYAATVFFPLPTEAVESVLDALAEENLDELGHSVIMSAETVVSQEFEELQREYEDTEESGERVAFEELRTQGREFVPEERTFVLLSMVSAVVATAGLLLNAPAIVVGSMVIAPLIGPAMATSVGTVLYEEELFRQGVTYQIGGFLLVVASSTVFAGVARTLYLVPPTVEVAQVEQVAGRLTPDLLTLAVAIGSGIAGARSLSSDLPTALVGVMIAAALVPPAAAVGIGVAWLRPAVVFNAGLVVLVNALSINLAALATLWYTGYRPSGWFEEARAEAETRKRLGVLLVGVLVLSAVLATFTVGAYQTATTTQDIRTDVGAVLDDPAYAELTVTETDVEYRGHGIRYAPAPSEVTVTLTRPDGERYPELADRIDDRIERGPDVDVGVQLRYVSVDAAD